MENGQWLVMAAVAIVAVVATIYFGIQNLRNVITQRERDAGYASGRVEAKLENLEQLVRGVTENVGVVNEKLDAHDVLLRQLRREAKRQSRRLRKLRKRVKVLEANGQMPPTDPTWDTGVLGVGGVDDVRTSVKNSIDKFINDWLAVNPLGGTA